MNKQNNPQKPNNPPKIRPPNPQPPRPKPGIIKREQAKPLQTN